MDKEIREILLEQMKLLAVLNKNESEPELVAKNVLAMVEIAKLFTP